MSDDKYAVSDRWGASADFKLPFDYELEVSKQLCQVRRLDMGDLIKLGIADELDFMSKALVSDDEKKLDEKAQDAVSRAVLKADNYERMEKMINTVVQAGVVQPKLYLPPRDEAARQKGLVYVDHLPWNDRLELFSVIFETEGLSSFRGKQEDGVGNVEHVQDVPLPAEPPVSDVRSDDSEGVLLQ